MRGISMNSTSDLLLHRFMSHIRKLIARHSKFTLFIVGFVSCSFFV